MPTISITDDQAFTVLRSFILDVLPAMAPENVRQGQANDIAMPAGDDFIIMIPASRSQLATTVREYRPDAGERDTTRSTRVAAMLNFYGDTAADNAQIFTTLYRDLYGCDFMRTLHAQPLWCDDGRQMPLVTGEQQYLNRWLVQAVLQINPTVSTSQEFADTVDVTLVEADS